MDSHSDDNSAEMCCSEKKKTIITWGRNINTWCSQAGREFNEQEQEKSERCRYKLEKMWGLQRREKKDASRECGL